MILKNDSYIWNRLLKEFLLQGEYGVWTQFIYSLDSNIERVSMNRRDNFTEIIFKTEHAETWFLLRWS